MIHRGEVKKTICIKYKNGVIRATNGDWIIKDSEGKIYSCTWGDFEKYYENLDNEKQRFLIKFSNIQVRWYQKR
ncbi:hypothetical protein KK425_03185 [Clostridioides difficile]|nr:hypothetical protein [Clostridioides difficile]